MTTKTKTTNYVIVLDYTEDMLLVDAFLLGWNNKYDWFDTDTCGDEILTNSGRVKRNKYGLLINIDRWVSIYASEDQSAVQSYADDGNREGYDCTVCKLEKNSDGDWTLVPVHPVTNI